MMGGEEGSALDEAKLNQEPRMDGQVGRQVGRGVWERIWDCSAKDGAPYTAAKPETDV